MREEGRSRGRGLLSWIMKVRFGKAWFVVSLVVVYTLGGVEEEEVGVRFGRTYSCKAQRNMPVSATDIYDGCAA